MHTGGNNPVTSKKENREQGEGRIDKAISLSRREGWDLGREGRVRSMGKFIMLIGNMWVQTRVLVLGGRGLWKFSSDYIQFLMEVRNEVIILVVRC